MRKRTVFLLKERIIFSSNDHESVMAFSLREVGTPYEYRRDVEHTRFATNSHGVPLGSCLQEPGRHLCLPPGNNTVAVVREKDVGCCQANSVTAAQARLSTTVEPTVGSDSAMREIAISA